MLTEESLGQTLDNAKLASDKAKAAADGASVALPPSASLLLMVYAPWCSYCKQLQPVFVEAAQALAKENVSALLLAVELLIFCISNSMV